MKITSLQEKQFDQTFWNLFNTRDQGRDGGGNWIICSLYRSLWSIQRGCNSYINPNIGTFWKMDKFNNAINTPIANLNHPLVSSRVVYASLFIYLGLAVFTLISFHLSITKRTMWIDPIAQWQHSWNLNTRAFLLALPKCLVLVKCDTI